MYASAEKSAFGLVMTLIFDLDKLFSNIILIW